MQPCILLKYGEIGLKGNSVRRYFEKRYVWAIRSALKRNKLLDWSIQNHGARYVVYTAQIDETVEVLKRVPGIQSLMPGIQFHFEDLEDFYEKIYEYASPLLKGKTFRVRARKGSPFDIGTQQLEAKIGSVLYDSSGGVNLTKPDVAISVELREHDGFVYLNSEPCLGGMPPKSSGHVLSLFSGGIDSPVSAFQMLKRGCMVDFLYIHLLGDKSINKVLQVYNFLINQYAFGYHPRLFVVQGQGLVDKIIKDVPDNLRQLALKTVFYKLSEKVALKNHHITLVTGEALAQKSTQTLQSLAVLDQQVTIPILRPLIGMDKLEIIDIARKIGTLKASERVKEYCQLSEGKVLTMPKLDDLSRLPDLDLAIDEALKTLKVNKGLIDLDEDQAVELSTKIEVVDMRLKHLQEAEPMDCDLELPYPEILDRLKEFDSQKSYLLVCDFGVRSEDVAFLLRKKGIKAAGVHLSHYYKYFAQNLKGQP